MLNSIVSTFLLEPAPSGRQNGNCCHSVENLLYDPWYYNYKGSGVDGWRVYPDGTVVPKFDKQRRSSQSKKRRSVQNKRGQYFQEW